jgi:hypothetical protein
VAPPAEDPAPPAPLDEPEPDEVPLEESLEAPSGAPGAPPLEAPPEELEEPAKPAGGDEDEDVLEETPDFLQETPEHDRLWFEQKPPRDFDFDE